MSLCFFAADVLILNKDPQAGGMCEVLLAAAWIVGEYADLCQEQSVVVDLLTRPQVLGLPSHIQAIFLHNAFKVMAAYITRV
jgi:hypothetical protein